MTNREEFEAWFKANSTQIIKDYGFGTFSEDVMFEAWQARGEVDAKRIAELEERVDGLLEKLEGIVGWNKNGDGLNTCCCSYDANRKWQGD